MEEHTDAAPRAYPQVHHLTAPLRAHGRSISDADLVNLWAGQAYELSTAPQRRLSGIAGSLDPEVRDVQAEPRVGASARPARHHSRGCV
jgi:hypothetical protein